MDKYLLKNLKRKHSSPSTSEPPPTAPPPAPSSSEDEPSSSRTTETIKQNFNFAWLRQPEFADWLAPKNQNGTNVPFCKWCVTTFANHRSDLVRHTKSKKHLNFVTSPKQPSVAASFRPSPLSKSVRAAEISFVALLATNNLPFHLMDSLTPLFQSSFHDSEIAKNVKLKRTKATAIMKNVLGNYYFKELTEKLRSTFFSVIMDETTDISTTKQCAIVVVFFDKDLGKVITRFYDLIEAKSGTADYLSALALDAFTSRGISLTQVVGFSSDTTNAMAGSLHSVFTNLKKEIPGIACIKCSCHMIHLCASNACLKLPRSVEDVLRNIGSHFSRSPSRQAIFAEFQNFFDIEIHKILSPCTTRWLSLKSCVSRILEQYPALTAYFLEIMIEDHSVTTESIHKTLSNPFTKIYLQFMDYILGLLTNFNTLFQSETPLLHRLKPEVKKLLLTLSVNFMDSAYVKSIDILNVTPSDKTKHVKPHLLYMGIAAHDSIAEIKDTVSQGEVNKFFETCFHFYVELVTEIKKRFQFQDEVFEILEVLEIKTVKQFLLPSLSKVVARFPVLRDHIDPQELDSEWRELCSLPTDDTIFKDLPDDDITSVTTFWTRVIGSKTYSGSTKYPNMFTVVTLLLSLPFSNAAVERVFSNLKNIKNIHRNSLGCETLSSLLIVKDSIDCIQTFKPNDEMLSANVWVTIEKKV